MALNELLVEGDKAENAGCSEEKEVQMTIHTRQLTSDAGVQTTTKKQRALLSRSAIFPVAFTAN